MKPMTASLVAIAVVVVAISIGITVYASVYSPTPEPEVRSLSISNEKCGFQNTPEEYVLNTTPPSVPDKLMVYRVVTNVSEADAASLAERLGMNGSVREAGGRFIVTDGQYNLKVSKDSGAIKYVYDARRSVDNYKPESLPSDDEAVAIASKFLEEKGLMPADAVPHKIEYSTSKVTVSFAPKSNNGLPSFKVSFSPEINGLPLIEGGFGMLVAVGGNGDIIWAIKDWREYELYKESSVITPEEAFEELNKSGITTGLRNVTTATINEVCFGYHYYVDYEQRYLKPIYKFKGVAKGEIDGHTETKPFSTLIYALSDDYPIPPAKKYVLNTTLPSVPDKLMVYKTAEPKVSGVEVASLAEQVGLNGSIREVSDGLLVTDGQYYLKVNNISGSVLYADIGKGEFKIQNIRFSGYKVGYIRCELPPPPGCDLSELSFEFGTCRHQTSALPSDDEAIEIAREFMDDTGLMPEEAVLRGVEHSKNGGMNVWFSREINGLPVTCDGSKIGVGVCDYQNIAGVFKVWEEYESHEEFSIITPEVALEEFKKDGEDAGRVNARGVVTINNVYLGYNSKSTGEKQAYLKPVYVFEGVKKGSGGTLEFEQYVVAAPELGGIENSKAL